MSFLIPPVFSWRSILLAVATTLVCTGAAAQWQWVDGSGRKVFSDTPPPPSIPEKDILKRAGSAGDAHVAAAPTTSTAAPARAATPQISGQDRQLEAKKKQAEAQEQALNK